MPPLSAILPRRSWRRDPADILVTRFCTLNCQNGDEELEMAEFRTMIADLDREKRQRGGKHSAHWHAGLAVLQAVDFEKSKSGEFAARCLLFACVTLCR